MATLATVQRSGRGPAQLRADIARTRQELARTVEDLSREVSAAMDWREWVRRYPEVAVGLAFGVGLWLGTHDLSEDGP